MTDSDETIIFRAPRPPRPTAGADASVPPLEETTLEALAPETSAEPPAPPPDEDVLAAVLEAPVPPPPPVEIPDIEPLRAPVLEGAFFGSKHEDIGTRLAAFLTTEKQPLQAWFGTKTFRELDAAALAGLLDRDIVQLDQMISAQLDAILHHQRLRRLEGSWRGLSWLAARLALAGRVKLRILNASWAEICRDFDRAPEFDSSQLFRAVYEDEFGMAGGEPYGLLLVDHEIRHQPGPGATTDDVSALANLASVAAAAFSPMVIGASPALLGVDAFTELSGVADPAAGFVAREYERWRSLASRDDTRFIAISMPRTLARPPWDEALSRHRGFRYREAAERHDARTWSSGIYLVAACVARAFETYSWPADMRGYDIDRIGGGLIENLPEPIFSVDPKDGLDRTALEVQFTDKQERALVAAGLLPIGTLPFGGQALLGATRSLQSTAAAPRFTGASAAAAAANTRLSSQFNTMLCVSRFAHYVKIIGRDMVGSFQTAEEIQSGLQNWLMRFVNANTDPGPEVMARYPLRDASVGVTEIPGKPGVFGCTVQLQPHFQLDDIAASFRLMTELAVPKPR
jgi:type VI secretion system protein ImpD/type VI secretion system protein ImpC